MNARSSISPSARVRRDLDHPVVDADGHIVESHPVIMDFIKQVGGVRAARRFEKQMSGEGASSWYRQSPRQRQDRRTLRPPFWAIPTSRTRDRATAMLPRLMRERQDEFGIDFAIVYTTIGLPFVATDDAELRGIVCRALNVMYAELFAPHQDRMTPAAVIPMHTPAEAIEEAEFAVRELGFKTVMIAGGVKRPVPYAERREPALRQYATWIDNLAIDSAYNYDPVWKKFVELDVSAATHNNTMGWGPRATTDSYVYNHIGHFAAAGEAFAKALFLGGVTRRFPTLKFAFLEGGAAWGTRLFNDLVEHWEKRNLAALKRNVDPDKLDRRRLAGLFRRYGEGALATLGTAKTPLDLVRENRRGIDEFARCKIRRKQEIASLFVPNFYYGCEADDRLSAIAFDKRLNPFGAKLKAMFSSDIGHWDVTQMNKVLAEAHELVSEGLLNAADFRDFTFTNAVEFHGSMNPEFFAGTSVESEAKSVLTKPSRRKAPPRG